MEYRKWETTKDSYTYHLNDNTTIILYKNNDDKDFYNIILMNDVTGCSEVSTSFFSTNDNIEEIQSYALYCLLKSLQSTINSFQYFYDEIEEVYKL